MPAARAGGRGTPRTGTTRATPPMPARMPGTARVVARTAGRTVDRIPVRTVDRIPVRTVDRIPVRTVDRTAAGAPTARRRATPSMSAQSRSWRT